MSKLGDVYLGYNGFVEAEAAFRIAIDENLANADAWTGLGKTLGTLKRHVESLECHKKAVKADPKSVLAKKELQYEISWPDRILDEAAMYVRGDDASSSGQGQENWAIRLCSEILSIYPDNARAIEIKERPFQDFRKAKASRSFFLPYLLAGCDKALK